ncbi:MAG: hypothetical protein LBS50_06530 [Prevotellaceae bacterium]|jgi:hypothetical protein|nr:hypothetical protein [Prevotellaceae bacterium]
MNIYLAAAQTIPEPLRTDEYMKGTYILESFYYVKSWQIPFIRNSWNFLLDSGAFTFVKNSKTKIDWENYCCRYADFINENSIDKYFELDIDALIGLKEVERLRDKLELLTNKKSISVWHISRGKEYFLEMVRNYDYVAFGGIITGGQKYRAMLEKYMPWFIRTAKKNDCKIHGLGFTGTQNFDKIRFHSVDSTTWSCGGRYGAIHKFKDGKISMFKAPKGKQTKDYITINSHNFKEWLKLQKYAERNY